MLYPLSYGGNRACFPADLPFFSFPGMLRMTPTMGKSTRHPTQRKAQFPLWQHPIGPRAVTARGSIRPADLRKARVGRA